MLRKYVTLLFKRTNGYTKHDKEIIEQTKDMEINFLDAEYDI